MTYEWRGRRSGTVETCAELIGKPGGYWRHRKADERPCKKCREAHNKYMKKYRRTHKDARQRETDAMRARSRAWRALAKRHKAEFDALLRVELAKVIEESAS